MDTGVARSGGMDRIGPFTIRSRSRFPFAEGSILETSLLFCRNGSRTFAEGWYIRLGNDPLDRISSTLRMSYGLRPNGDLGRILR